MQDLPHDEPRRERSAKEYVILSTCLAGVFSVLPFTIFRFLSKDWLIAFFDVSLIIAISSVLIYVYISRKTVLASWILTAIFSCGLAITAWFKGAEQILWCYPIAVGIYYLVSAPKAAVVNAIALAMVFVVVQQEMLLKEKVLFCITLVAVNVFTYVFSIRNEIQRRHLEELSLIDPLTGVGNKRAFDHALKDISHPAATKNEELALILLDIDFFKKVNDTFGHVTGDDVLVKLASLLQFNLQSGSKLYRIGGEEYAIFPIKMNEGAALEFAEELRKAVEQSELMSDHTITISLGVADIDPNASPKDWIRRADEALYSAKRNGRNKSETYSNFLEIQPTYSA